MEIGVRIGEESEHTTTFKLLEKLVQAHAKVDNVPFHDLQ